MIYERRLQPDSDSQQRETLSTTLFFSNAHTWQENMLVLVVLFPNNTSFGQVTVFEPGFL